MNPGHKCKLGSSLVLAALISTGCATATKDSKDTSGTYDGDWTAEVIKASSSQRVHNWVFTCADLSEEASMTVTDGVVNLTLSGREYTSFVGSNGKFKITLDVGRASASSKSEGSLANRSVRVFITGNLAKSPAKGSIVVGFAQVGYNGCTSKINYTRN